MQYPSFSLPPFPSFPPPSSLSLALPLFLSHFLSIRCVYKQWKR